MSDRAAVVRRRLISVSRAVGIFLLVTALSPVLVLGVGTVDLFRRLMGRPSWIGLRLLAFGWTYLAVSLVGILRFGLEWVAAGFGRNQDAMIRWGRATQRFWARTLLSSVRRLLRLEFDVEGEEVLVPGPYVAMFRHASIVDNLLPAVLISDRHGVDLRWIIKRELLNDPGIDIGGNRLPNHFVDRASDDPMRELAAIRRLVDGITDREGILIFPEGTRFTEEKRERALTSTARRHPGLAERASRLRNVLPPRLGGPLALLDTGLDVVVCAHHGFGGFAKISDIWRGTLIGTKVSVKFWRFPASEVPGGREARVGWLYDLWQMVDDWISTKQAAPA